MNLFEKNNNVKTGYENFCIKKGCIKLLPFQDFDFIGKNVVCQKCCQKFASKMSYKAHVGTDICVRTYNGPNLIYLKYKNKNGRRVRKKNKNKSMEDLIGHDIKKNLLNPEMLNTLQTRNNCYSDVVHQRNKVKEKHRISPSKSDEPAVKKPRGRPRKNNVIEPEPRSGEPRKRGRPKKFIPVSVDSFSETDNSLTNNLESHDSESNEPRIDNCSVDDAYNNNLNESGKETLLSSKIKILSEKFWNIINSVWRPDTDTVGYQHSAEYLDQTQSIKEKTIVDSLVPHKISDIFYIIDALENDLKLLYKQFQSKNEYSHQKEVELMLSELIKKRNEFKQSKSKTDKINESTTDKGKENIHCSIMESEEEIERTINKIDYNTTENVENWLNNDMRDTVSPTMTIIMNDDCESSMSTDINSLEKESSNDSFEDNIETLIEDITPKYSNSVNNHLNNVDLNYISNPMLNCRICGRYFASIAEWKIHSSEHLPLINKQFLCTICGIKFKMYKNYRKHINVHRKMERKNKDTKNLIKLFKCKVCNKQFNYLRSYYAHIKNHGE